MASKKKTKKKKRKLTPYNKCLSKELKGKMSDKTKAERTTLFKDAVKICKPKAKKKEES